MKIIFLASMRGFGGIQKFNQGLAMSLRQHGAQVEVVEREAASSSLGFAARVVWKFLLVRPDVIFCGHVHFSPLAHALSLFGVPYVVFVHGIEAWNLSGSGRGRALRAAKLVSAVSKFSRDKIAASAGLLADRLFLLPNFVRGDHFKPQLPSSEFLLSSGILDRKAILTVARFAATERYKGYDAVLRALPAVRRKVPDLVYVLVGDGDDLPRVRSLAVDMGLSDAVIFAGKVSDEDLLNYYNACHLFVMPSKGEGFGIVFLEALACGKPVIAGNADGASDALLGGELGFLVDPDSTQDLDAALTACLTGEPPSRRLDPAYLRSRVLEEYGAENFHSRVGELLGILGNTIGSAPKDNDRLNK